MNINNIMVRLSIIRSYAAKKDHEAAHSAEDDLYRDLLSAIANGTARQPKAMSALAITSQDIKFDRYTS